MFVLNTDASSVRKHTQPQVNGGRHWRSMSELPCLFGMLKLTSHNAAPAYWRYGWWEPLYPCIFFYIGCLLGFISSIISSSHALCLKVHVPDSFFSPGVWLGITASFEVHVLVLVVYSDSVLLLFCQSHLNRRKWQLLAGLLRWCEAVCVQLRHLIFLVWFGVVSLVE